MNGLVDNISDEELEMAKTNMKVRLLSGIEDPAYRLTETLKNIRTYGEVKHGEYLNWIDSISASEIKTVVAAVLKGRPSLVAAGGNVATLTNLTSRE